MSVTFLHRMRKSYKVDVSPEIRMFSERGAHVETDMEGLNGQTFPLGQRSVRALRGQTAVMYEVKGVTNRGYPAHITVYFGPSSGSEAY